MNILYGTYQLASKVSLPTLHSRGEGQPMPFSQKCVCIAQDVPRLLASGASAVIEDSSRTDEKTDEG